MISPLFKVECKRPKSPICLRLNVKDQTCLRLNVKDQTVESMHLSIVMLLLAFVIFELLLVNT